MRTTVTRAGRASAALAGVLFAAGCGGAEAPSASATSASAASSPASFGQEAVRADVEKAVAAAGLPKGGTEAGYPDGGGLSAGAATAEERRKVAALIARLSPCVVLWSPDGKASFSTNDPAGARRTFDAVLSGLEARDWGRAQPFTEAPVGDDGTHVVATYEKRGWTLHARHSDLGSRSLTSVMATEDDCFNRVTDEERALLDAA
ncbi:hypothetical protein HLK59_19655 [Streptomyces sp. S3(2020)]|uniref:hypothetical protein n=1 Tax=Streptomyces sp. S3(2020) TaxID=2732044 RepID=UPI0014880251|nr:hypothetical protein [Streptomyces sp. S3(2020)]NNN32537.1 hypothetical protein [Streptomyces sp. S3(2020)]